VQTIPPKLTIRYDIPDGRCSTMITWPDGEWKVEIFASMEHALQFAKENHMEVHDARSER
jgi:hypothetical protein